VLKVLKENSFKSNPYPVLFSIEMHCNAKMQAIMAKLYRDILIDIYAVNPENPPEHYPSPHELKGMFIIKEGRPRILRKSISILKRCSTINEGQNYNAMQISEDTEQEHENENDSANDSDDENFTDQQMLQYVRHIDEDVGKNNNI
jgi:hypothetical protein